MLKYVAAALLALSTIPANAATINVTNVTGTWVDIDPNVVAGATPLGTNEIRWGIPAGIPLGQSGYRFDGAAPPTQNFVVGSSNFQLGDFTHYNFPIQSGTSITGATMNLQVKFTGDFFVGERIMNSQFIFSHNETPNVGDNNCCPDIVTAVLNLGNSDLFNVGGVDYAFNITGFQQGGINFASFVSPEGGTNHALLMGTFAAAPVPGPMVGAGIPGLIAACGGLVALARRRRRQQAIS
jgi:hypothetical protein